MWIDGDALVGGSLVKATSSFDLPLIRTLGKAFYWQRMIDTARWPMQANWRAVSNLRWGGFARCYG